MGPRQPSPQDHALPPYSGSMGHAEKLSLAAALLWLVLGAGLLWLAPQQLGLAGYLLPLLLLGAAHLQARQLRRLRQQSANLQAALDRLQSEAKAAQPSQTPAKPRQDAPCAPVETPLFRAHSRASAPSAPPAAPAPAFASRREPATPTPPAADTAQSQLSLGLGPTAPAPLAVADFLSALNFPQSAEDTDGFRALRLALRHPPSVPLIQAAQDVLTLLSQIGLYVDDLQPDHAHPDLWRRFFAEGERGGAMAALGAVRDTDALLTCANLMRDDPVFRDAAHHFLRRFELLLAARINDLSDADLIRLADTRSARAFMLLGRVAGVFD